MSDIVRIGGSQSYTDAVAGRNNGVDLLGSSMNFFMGTEVLPELLVMGRVGIYIDMPSVTGETIADTVGARPYLYVYPAEDVRSWDYDETPLPNEFRSVLLSETINDYDEVTNLPIKEKVRYRFYWMKDGIAYVQFYDEASQKINPDGTPSTEPIKLNIGKIPFIVLELNDSLLTDIADYQIALLNLASADMSYCVRANFPFYIEQFDSRTMSPYIRRPGAEAVGDATDAILANAPEKINVGPATGRRYPINTNPPAFIHPSAEPMKASMEKQEQLKREIRLLINLAITNIQPKMASAESKGFDERTLESGLSYIGLLLQDAESRIADIWSRYEGKTDNKSAVISYPEKYNLKSDDDRRKEVAELTKLRDQIPSDTYKKEIDKQIVRLLFGHRLQIDTLKKIDSEIEKAPIGGIDPVLLVQIVQAGICDPETASEIYGFPAGTVDKANKYQAERLARIQKAQAPRGVSDASPDSSLQNKSEKELNNLNPDGSVTDNTRGNGALKPQ